MWFLELLLDIFFPWVTNPLHDGTFRGSYPRTCAAILLTTLGLTAGTLASAWLTPRLLGHQSALICATSALLSALATLLLTLWIFSRTDWLED